jgi:hypothetical protein
LRATVRISNQIRRLCLITSLMTFGGYEVASNTLNVAGITTC